MESSAAGAHAACVVKSGGTAAVLNEKYINRISCQFEKATPILIMCTLSSYHRELWLNASVSEALPKLLL